MFRAGGPKPWQTRPGDSHLDVEIEDAASRKASLVHDEGKTQVLRKDGMIGVQNETV